MKFTDIFIRRPVLAMVVSLMILVLGLRAVGSLPVLQYPRTENAVVTVSTIYYGADPDVIAGFITTPLELAIAQANGIDYMSSTSTPGVSTITVNLRLNYPSDKALVEIQTKVSSVINQLPPNTLQPVLTVKIGQTIDAMYIGFSSDVLAPNQVTDYLVRVVQPKLQAVHGVQTAETLGAEDYESQVGFDGQKAVYIGIQVAPAANLLDVIKGVRDVWPEIVSQLPQGLNGKIVYDASAFVNSSIQEVIRTLVEALLIVTAVVFLFLGSVRSVLIPTVAIPLSLVGTFTMMAAFGFSINLLTLLALVLAIGLVVDDAIIVVENVNRHLEEGMKPMAAAIRAARELGGPIIAMTAVLVAVYIPIGFQGGLTGALFTEFAFTLVGAVTVSAIIALTLSPMMTSRLLKPPAELGHGWQARFTEFIDRNFARLRGAYERGLHGSLNFLPVTATLAVIVLGSIYFLYTSSKTELAPIEDQGVVIESSRPAPDATLQQKLLYARQVYTTFAAHPETAHVFQLDAPGLDLGGMVLTPWDERSRTSNELQPVVQQELSHITGINAVAFQPPPLPGSFGLPIQFVIGTTEPFNRLNTVSQTFLQDALKTGLFIFLDTDLRVDQPQATIVIDRDKTAELGLKMSDVGAALSSILGGGYVNYFDLQGRSYKVIPQVEQVARLNPNQLLHYYIKASDGTVVPLSTVAHIQTEAIPEAINHFQQLNSATIQGVAAPGVSMGTALAALKDLADRTLPPGYGVDYAGTSRQYIQETGGFIVTFGFALIIIFLALAALFESFRDPFIILVSVPMSIAGALIFISTGVGGATLNIYTEVGLVTLMGLISKHGILIVDFANEQQMQGKTKREAIEHASGIRLRPILMTTAAMVLGVIPLITATGAGAVSRFNMGLVIASGLAIGTLFTLFVVPAVYMLVGADHSKAAEAEADIAPEPEGV